MNSYLTFAAAVVLACLSTFSSGCANTTSAHARQPERKIIFVDQSDSVSDAQRERWLAFALKTLAAVEPGDGVYIYGLHDHTLDAAPLVAAEIPPLPARPTRTQLGRTKQALKALRANGKTILSEALRTHTPSRATDVFSVVDRCRPDAGGRPTEVYVYSDMLEATREFNMERHILRDAEFVDVISKIAALHHWDGHVMDGAMVFVVLPSAERGAPATANDRLVLERFYRALFRAVGGELRNFDTHISAGRRE